MKDASGYVVVISSTRRRMKLKRLLGFMLCVFLTGSSVILLDRVTGEESQTTRIFTDPSGVQSADIGQNFTVNINISNVVDLYAWQTGIAFNPGVLECTGFYEGEFLRRSGETTIFVKHFKDMNNTLGTVYFRGCCLLGAVPGVNGSGQLAYVTFRAVGIGVSDFHLTDVLLLNTELEDIEFEVAESFTVPVYGIDYGVEIANNLKGVSNPTDPPLSGVFDTAFSVHDKKISFDALTMEDWFCQVSIPKELLRCNALSEWTIKVDGAPISYIATENATYTSLHFNHSKGNHTVEIIGTEIITGNPPDLAPPPLLVVVAVALLGLASLTLALVDFKRTRRVLGYGTTSPSTNSFL